MPLKIGIINAGNIGLHLAISLARAGHTIKISKDGPNASDLPTRLASFSSAHNLTPSQKSLITTGTLVEAAQFSSELTIFGVYFPRFAAVISELQAAGVTFANRGVVIDTANPLNVDKDFNHYHDLEYMARTSTTEELAKAFPEAVVVKAFSTLPAELLDPSKWEKARREGRLDRPTMLYVGGEGRRCKGEAARDGGGIDRRVRGVIEDAGFRPVWAGKDLEDARLIERIGILLHRVSVAEFGGDLNIGFTFVKP